MMILITPKQEVEQVNKWFSGVKCFRSKFKAVKNGVWTKYRSLNFLFLCHILRLMLTILFIFFLNGSPIQFIVHSKYGFSVKKQVIFKFASRFVLLCFFNLSHFFVCSYVRFCVHILISHCYLLIYRFLFICQILRLMLTIFFQVFYLIFFLKGFPHSLLITF